MQYNLEEIKRLKICPILHQEGWDYASLPIKVDPTFKYGIREIFKWHSRRGSPITYEVLSSAISTHYYQTKRNDPEELLNIQEAFRKFIDKGFYSKLKDPVFNHEIMIDISNGNVMKYKIPLLTFYRDILYCIFYDWSWKSFHTTLEAQAIAVWAFYSLDQYPRFLFFSEEDGEIREKVLRYNYDYIKEAKKNLYLHGSELTERVSLPSAEVCNSCLRRTECPRTSIQKWLKE